MYIVNEIHHFHKCVQMMSLVKKYTWGKWKNIWECGVRR